MFPEKLDNDKHYIFTSEEIFRIPLATVCGFTEYAYKRNMHLQEFYEINIILSGVGMHYIGDGRVDAFEGDVFIIPPGLKHGYMGDCNFDVYHLLMSPAFFEKHSADLMLLPGFSALFMVEPAMRERFCTNLNLRLTKNELSTLIPLLESIRHHSYKGSAEHIIISQSEAMILIARLCSFFSLSLDRDNGASASGSD